MVQEAGKSKSLVLPPGGGLLTSSYHSRVGSVGVISGITALRAGSGWPRNSKPEQMCKKATNLIAGGPTLMTSCNPNHLPNNPTSKLH